MEIVVSIAAKIVKYTVEPIVRHLGYTFRYTNNVDNLKTQMQDLKVAKERLQHRVNAAINNCQEIEADVQNWLTSVEQISERADTFLNQEDHAKVVCSYCGSALHLVTRHQLSRKAKKMSIDVREVYEKNNFDSMQISYHPHLERSFVVTKGYETFDSRKGILKEIMVAMRDANRIRIGLYGMGGIGKTMLAKEIARQVEEEKLFSKVVMTTISQKPNIKEIQQDIAGKLHLRFNETDSMDIRAYLLQKRLKQESGILLILDDIWKELDLDVVGIHDECKMLLTSRYLHVLRSSMSIVESNIFSIKALDFGEAISLFTKIIGEIVEKPDYNDLAQKIVGECAGLPVSIVTVAHALKCNMELYRWADALQRLQSSNFTGIDGMHDKVYASIRLSYDFLGSHEGEAKSLLLLCALHKEDAEIEVEVLMRYSVGCRLLQGIYTVNEARNRVNSLVDKLKSHCLLLDGRSKSYVKMHDVIRDVCILIAKEDEQRMNSITSATMYEEFVLHERHKASNAVSFLDYDDLNELPKKLECPRLKLLLLPGCYLQSIPDEFFEQTKQLEALGMNDTYLTGQLEALGVNGTYLKSLPSSFHFLQCLQTLCLRNCSNLNDIAVIGELKNLKVLDLSSSSIKLLPKEIGELRRLQLLDLRECDNLKVIKPNVISNLTQMEELYMPKEFEGWENEEGRMKERRNASLIEIKSLQRLVVLYLSVPSEYVLPQGLFTKTLERYRVSIGGTYVMHYENEISRWLHLNLSQMNEINASGLESLVKGSEYLSLERLMDVNNVAPSLDKDGFPRLKHLILIQLTSLERICHGGKLPTGWFNELRKVQVRSCGKLKNLFPLFVTKLLHEIIVEECEMMEEIVSHGGENEGDDEATHNIDESLQLRSLSLHSLPNIVQFYCSKLKTTGESSLTLFSETVSFSNLEQLTMSRMNIERLWPEQLLSSSYMQNLTNLEVQSCNSLKYMFSFTVAQTFVNLKSLKVSDCKAMEVIGVKLGEEETQLEMSMFPKLEYLELVELSALQRFCATNSRVEELKTLVSSPAVPIQVSVDHREVNILVSTEPFFNEKVSLLILKQLILKKLNVETLWPGQQLLSNPYLQNLTSLEVLSCNRIKYMFCFAMAERLVNLKNLWIEDCVAMECILKGRKLREERSSLEIESNTLFAKLETLNLSQLPVFKTFCLEDSCIKQVSVGDNEGKIVPKQHLFNGMIVFPNLKELTIFRCNNIKYLLSSAMARSLVQLKTLDVYGCENIEEVIVIDEESDGGSKAIIFEKLESLQLKDLPNVIKFCEGDGIECPLLSELYIRDCPKLKQFISNSMGNSACIASEEMDIVVASKQSIFQDKVIFPNLKYLHTDWSEAIKEIFEIMSSQSSSIISTFPNLSELNVNYISCDNPIALSDVKSFLHKYQNIHTLTLEGFFVDGHRQQRQPGDELINNTSLMKLSIENAYMLNHVFGNPEYAQPSHIILFQNLKSLYTYRCNRLQSFAPSFMSFHKLETLIVSDCDGLTYLFSSSTAATLVQLKQIKVTNCKRMREVINGDYYNHDEKGQIEAETEHHHFVFKRLETLDLEDLPSLESFYSGNKVMSFPNLEELTVRGCLGMMSFSHGIISTSALFNTIKIFDGIANWEGDVNTTVRKHWEDNSNLGLRRLFSHETILTQLMIYMVGLSFVAVSLIASIFFPKLVITEDGLLLLSGNL
ncbi:disease resistance protein At4g27190-like [Humulus lupulus]|uniref:disease resistance protein At4g27190-like n=1 Tax=Humulus lupulus TaxID=3486 RepID=UPI002B411DB1|nr:disease resistance protein At4g27190-like [Humulus lupulus]